MKCSGGVGLVYCVMDEVQCRGRVGICVMDDIHCRGEVGILFDG